MAKVKKTTAKAGRAKKKTPSRTSKTVAKKKASRGSTTSKKTAKAVAKKKSVAKPSTKSATKKEATTAAAKAKLSKTAKPTRKKSVTTKKVGARRATAAKTKTRPTAAATKKRPNVLARAAAPSSNGKGEPTQPAMPREKPFPKTHLRPDELDEFKQLLLDKRAELAGDVQHLANESAGRNSEAGADHSSMPIHMADLGSDNWEHEFTLGLIANEQVRIREIDGALSRIENMTYGVCLATRKRIRKARLRAKPWAKYCIEYARAREEGRV